MNPFINREEIRKRCRNPKFCIACFRIRDKVKVDEHHICESCRNGSDGMPRRLPVVTLENGKSYFVDNRLQQLRHIHNPHDYVDYEGTLKMIKGGERSDHKSSAVKLDNCIYVYCPECGKLLFFGTQKQAKRLIIYCVDCSK